MSMVEIKIDDRETLRALDDIRTKCRQRGPLLREIAGIMHHAVEENFAHEGRPDKWKPLAAGTIRQRRAKGTWPGRILQARGRLAASIQEKSDNDSVAVGTNVKYARIHQFGGEIKHGAREHVLHFGKDKRFARPSKAKYGMKASSGAHTTTMPARPFLHLEPTDLRRIMDAAKRYLATGV